MPVCKGCGGSYDEKFKFCPYCGRAKPEPEEIKIQVNVSSADRWEIAKIYRVVIDYRYTRNWSDGYFWAEGIGPHGILFAGESAPFRIFHNLRYSGESIAHSFFVNQLVKNGWEATSSAGIFWWQMEFRRHAGENYPEPHEIWFIWRKPLKFGKACFSAIHLPRDQGDKWIEHGESKAFNDDLLYIPGSFKQTEDRKRILSEFLQSLKREGFIPIDHDENEVLKKCLAINTDAFWHLQFLRRPK